MLAVGALILIIVLLAVPALKADSENVSFKNDANNIVGGIAEFQSNNSGVLPTANGYTLLWGLVVILII